MTGERIHLYGQRQSGDRAISVRVLGVEILLTPGDAERQETAMALARQIAALGPEDGPENPQPIPALPVTKSEPVKWPVFSVGQRIWCKVHGAQGYCTVTEVGAGRNRGRIKITNCRSWCPAGNFLTEAP